MSNENTEFQIGLSLSGGGSRAIAFHLGCLRSLYKKNLLQRVSVISCVSGGSVIGAMYAYSNDSFEELEDRVTSLLKVGLARKTLWHWLRGRFILGLLNLGIIILFQTINTLFKTSFSLHRKYSRTESLQKVLDKFIFSETSLSEKTRNNLQIILNACELQTKTAFRFSNTGVSSWKFGVASPDNILVAHAVTASASYPLFLPALEREYLFRRNDGSNENRKVILTDGGIYENMGVSPLMPDRQNSPGLKVTPIDFVISCDAGNGVDEKLSNQWIGNRIFHCFDSIMRRTQASSFKLLHEYKSTGAIKGFILAYLSLDDKRLQPLDFEFLTKRELGSYGTNFSAMKEKDIQNLSLRGEQVMDNLIERYWN